MKITDLNTPQLVERVAQHGPGLLLYAAVVAEAYEAAPRYEERAVPGYIALAKSNDVLLKRLQSDVDVNYTSGDPYKRHRDMVQDVVGNKKLTIWNGADEPHPYMTNDQNVILRTVHDYYAHTGPNRKAAAAAPGKALQRNDFTYRGELNAYLTHVRIAPRAAVPILFTEVAAQISYHLISGGYAPQKAMILDGFDYIHLGKFTSPDRQKRFDERTQEYTDTQQITVAVKGGMTLTHDAMNWKQVSRGTRANVK
jgi:hypothetical protein